MVLLFLLLLKSKHLFYNIVYYLNTAPIYLIEAFNLQGKNAD